MEDQEDIKNYETLFLRNGNTSKFLDYDILLELYQRYLLVALNQQSSLYLDMIYISLLVSGFSYYLDKIFGESTLTSSDIVLIVEGIFEKVQRRENFTKEDQIYFLSHLLVQKLDEQNLLQFYRKECALILKTACRLHSKEEFTKTYQYS